ncbi:MAG: hypothetical protein AB8G22_20690 [Saprospiraceae bacterium]
MRLLILFITTMLFACAACDTEPLENGNNDCFAERLETLKAQTREQDAASLTVYKKKNSTQRYFVYYYAEERGMLDKGGVVIVDENCEQICNGGIMMHWTFCVEGLEIEDVEEVEVLWTTD